MVLNYAKLHHDYWRHHQRFKRRAMADGLVCQECGGAGGETEPLLDDGSGPFEQCGWCEGIGFVTRWIRGLWLRMKREDK